MTALGMMRSKRAVEIPGDVVDLDDILLSMKYSRYVSCSIIEGAGCWVNNSW
jgi:hypothetical protein